MCENISRKTGNKEKFSLKKELYLLSKNHNPEKSHLCLFPLSFMLASIKDSVKDSYPHALSFIGL